MIILSTTDVVATDWTEVFFIIGITSAVLILFGILFSYVDKNPRAIMWSIIICIVFAIWLCSATKNLGLFQECTGEKEHKIVFVEKEGIYMLNEKYEIVDKDGAIYTVRERVQND